MSASSERFAACPLSDPGTAQEEWVSATEQLHTLDTANWARVVLAVAHPDDEVLGPGALIADLAARGIDIETIIASHGEGAIPGAEEDAREALAHVRRQESVRAAAVLGAPTPLFLGLPDGGLHDHEARIAEAIASAARRDAAATPDRRDSGDLVVLAHWAHDGHSDHEAVGRAAMTAVERLREAGHRIRLVAFPVWALHWDTPTGGYVPWAHAVRSVVSAEAAARKQSAVQEFTSQNEAWPAGSDAAPVMPEHVVRRLVETPEWVIPEWVIPEPLPSTREPVDSRAHLEGLYARDVDPWDLETSAYEAEKRGATLAAIPHDRYRLCFEPGCSIGVLTVELAQRADRVLAWDPVERALERARERVSASARQGEPDARRVRLEQRALSAGGSGSETELGAHGADLIVLSEMLYFIPHAELRPILTGLVERAAPGAHIVAVHWRHPVAGWPEGGAATHDALLAVPGLTHLHRDAQSRDYLIDVCQVERR